MWHFVREGSSYGINILQTRKLQKGWDWGIFLCLTMVPSESLVVKITKCEQGCESEMCLTFISVVLRAKCGFDGVKGAALRKHYPVTWTLSLQCPILVFGCGKYVETHLPVSFSFPHFCSWSLLGFCLYRKTEMHPTSSGLVLPAVLGSVWRRDLCLLLNVPFGVSFLSCWLLYQHGCTLHTLWYRWSRCFQRLF